MIENQIQTPFVMADATGRIVSTGSMPQFMLALQTPPAGGKLVVGSGHWDTHYVVGDAIYARPANTATLNGMQLENLPVPCSITAEGVEHACEDRTAELSFSHPGTYAVKVVAWPMLDVTFEVTQA
jgi:hypothetical protein